MPTRRHRRTAVICLLALVAVLVPAGGWSAHLGLSVRDHLEATRGALLRLRAAVSTGQPSLLAAPLADAGRHAAEARRLTGGADWSLLTHLPMMGDAASTVRGLSEGVAELTGVLDDLQHAGAAFITPASPAPGGVPAPGGTPAPGGAAPPAGTPSPGGTASLGATLSPGGSRRLLAAVEAAAPVLDDAVTRLARVSSLLASTPARTGVEALDEARGTALREIDELRGMLGDAVTAATLLPPMLGGDDPRRYFLAFQTNAEARGTGGLVGAFGILRLDRGKIVIERLSSNNDLDTSPVPVTDPGPGFRGRYGPNATRMLSVSNLSPHFPYAAAIWTGLWERQARTRLDGAIATDPVGLAHLLRVIGPVTAPGGQVVTAGNVVDLTERVAYARFPDPLARKVFLMGIARAVGEALPTAFSNPARLLPVLAGMVGERRLQVWSRHPAEQRLLARTPLGGVLPSRPGPFAALVVNNSAGGKLDYYLERSLHYRLGHCRDGRRVSTVRVRLTNDVPRKTLPSYVTGRLDNAGMGRHRPGSNLLWVSLYAGVGAEATAARLDGDRAPIIRETERSHPVYSTMVEFAPGQSRSLEFDLTEPVSNEPPLVPVQPLVRPQRTRVTQDTRGCAP
ncbi:DUF4012 domain-containing protein [Streptosporangium sp. NPDC023615]|uniref:DUF4012 domain-containing protein n=1 Tax=Streptosporangium sp. NPDC023615 TaxID=3154794 RepID=UPI00344379FC